MKILLTLEQQKESSVPGPGLDSMPVISNNVHSTHNHWVSLTSEIVYQVSGRTMTDGTHEVGIS